MNFLNGHGLLLLFQIIFLESFAIHPAYAIVTGSGQQQPGAGHGVITGPSPTSNWAPAAVAVVNLNYYLNVKCETDDDCFPSRTMLYCINYKCQCITQGATFINNYFYNYNMEWNEHLSQCTSQSGSPCTLKRYWYSPDVLKMECVQGNECVEISSPVAKATISAQNPAAFGSTVSAQQSSYQHNQQQRLHPPLHLIQYFGSGVTQLTNNDHGAATALASASSTATATASSANTWGICVLSRSGISASGQFGDKSSTGKSDPVSILSLIGLYLFIGICAT